MLIFKVHYVLCAREGCAAMYRLIQSLLTIYKYAERWIQRLDSEIEGLSCPVTLCNNPVVNPSMKTRHHDTF